MLFKDWGQEEKSLYIQHRCSPFPQILYILSCLESHVEFMDIDRGPQFCACIYTCVLNTTQTQVRKETSAPVPSLALLDRRQHPEERQMIHQSPRLTGGLLRGLTCQVPPAETPPPERGPWEWLPQSQTHSVILFLVVVPEKPHLSTQRPREKQNKQKHG